MSIIVKYKGSANTNDLILLQRICAKQTELVNVEYLDGHQCFHMTSPTNNNYTIVVFDTYSEARKYRNYLIRYWNEFLGMSKEHHDSWKFYYTWSDTRFGVSKIIRLGSKFILLYSLNAFDREFKNILDIAYGSPP